MSTVDLEFRSLGKCGIGRANDKDTEAGRLIHPRSRPADHRNTSDRGGCPLAEPRQGCIVRGPPVRLGCRANTLKMTGKHSCDL